MGMGGMGMGGMGMMNPMMMVCALVPPLAFTFCSRGVGAERSALILGWNGRYGHGRDGNGNGRIRWDGDARYGYGYGGFRWYGNVRYGGDGDDGPYDGQSHHLVWAVGLFHLSRISSPLVYNLSGADTQGMGGMGMGGMGMGGMGMMNPMMMGMGGMGGMGMGMGGMVSHSLLSPSPAFSRLRFQTSSLSPVLLSTPLAVFTCPLFMFPADTQGMGGGLGSGAYGVSHLSPWLQTLIPRSFWYG